MTLGEGLLVALGEALPVRLGEALPTEPNPTKLTTLGKGLPTDLTALTTLGEGLLTEPDPAGQLAEGRKLAEVSFKLSPDWLASCDAVQGCSTSSRR